MKRIKAENFVMDVIELSPNMVEKIVNEIIKLGEIYPVSEEELEKVLKEVKNNAK